MANSEIQSIVGDFVDRLQAALEADIIARLQANVAAALGVPVKRGPGRPPKNAPAFAPVFASMAPMASTRRKRPRQLCPVPGCTNTAAPIFGMVCSDHKDVSKTKIREYREARKAGKPAKMKAAKATKPAKSKGKPGPRGAKKAAKSAKKAAEKDAAADRPTA